MTEQAEPRPEQDVLQLERDVGARPGMFLKLLLDDDDWTFVIKVHALVEAAVTHLLTESCGVSALERHFARLELSSATLGKLAIAKDLGVLDSEERGQVRKLSELRNKLVHDVANTDFSFETWAKSLDSKQLKEFAAAFGSSESMTIGDHKFPPGEFFRQNPRLCIWLAFLFLLSLIYQRKELAKSKNTFREEVFEKLSSLARASTAESGTSQNDA